MEKIKTKISFKDASRINWTPEVEHNSDSGAYPSDERVAIGCFMRMAESLEKIEKTLYNMQVPYELQNERMKEQDSIIETMGKNNKILRDNLKAAKTELRKIKNVKP